MKELVDVALLAVQGHECTRALFADQDRRCDELTDCRPDGGDPNPVPGSQLGSPGNTSSAVHSPSTRLWEGRGIAGFHAAILTTTNPAIKTVKDPSGKDKIALPAAQISIRAVVLQMAAAQAFGDDNYTPPDSITLHNPTASDNHRGPQSMWTSSFDACLSVMPGFERTLPDPIAAFLRQQ